MSKHAPREPDLLDEMELLDDEFDELDADDANSVLGNGCRWVREERFLPSLESDDREPRGAE